MKPPSQHVSVRRDDALIERIDALVPQFSRLERDATRSDVLREVILLGLARFERDPEGAMRELTQRDKTEPEPK